jgi:hypothetical protein
MVYDRDDPDEGDSVLDSIKGRLGVDSEGGRTRDPDGSCDNCGFSEGSVVHDRDEGWTLCRECMNDPDILNEYVD